MKEKKPFSPADIERALRLPETLVKKDAKALKDQHPDLSHRERLDFVAHQHGFEGWKHYLRVRQAALDAKKTPVPAPTDFHPDAQWLVDNADEDFWTWVNDNRDEDGSGYVDCVKFFGSTDVEGEHEIRVMVVFECDEAGKVVSAYVEKSLLRFNGGTNDEVGSGIEYSVSPSAAVMWAVQPGAHMAGIIAGVPQDWVEKIRANTAGAREWP